MGSAVRRCQCVDGHVEPSREFVESSPLDRTADDEGLGACADGEALELVVPRAVRADLDRVEEEVAQLVGVERYIEPVATGKCELAAG